MSSCLLQCQRFAYFFHPPAATVAQPLHSSSQTKRWPPKDHRPKGPSLANAGLSRQPGWGKLKYPSGRQSTLLESTTVCCAASFSARSIHRPGTHQQRLASPWWDIVSCPCGWLFKMWTTVHCTYPYGTTFTVTDGAGLGVPGRTRALPVLLVGLCAVLPGPGLVRLGR